jgi:predicted ATP-binding protein involved in virulence
MHVKKVVLNNFRCFEEFELDLHPRLTVLVAENGGGKTAILDGIASGLSPVLRYLSSANQRLSGPGIKDTDYRLELWETRGGERWGASDYAQIVIETVSGLRWDHWRASALGKQPILKVGQTELKTYAAAVLESLKTSTPDLLPVFAYYGARRGWIVIPERLRESKVDYTHPTSALEGSLESLSDFKEMLKWFDLEEAAELRGNKGKGAGSFTESPALAAVRSAIKSILGSAYENPRFNNRHKFVIESKVDGSPVRASRARHRGQEVLPLPEAVLGSEHTTTELQVSQLSQGYQSMLALGMDFARRLALANSQLHQASAAFDWAFATDYVAKWHPGGLADAPPKGPAWAPAIMLVDEIDLHLHPSWQQRVLGDLMRTFPGTQFIVTTHSPQVLSTVPMESIRIIKSGQIYAAPPGTDGAEAQRILEDVFQVSPRPDTPMSSALDEYLRLVDARRWDNPRAVELRQKLDDWSQGYEPRLLEADLQIENMRWEDGR